MEERRPDQSATARAPLVDWQRLTVWGLYAVAAGLPLYLIRWHVGPLPTTLLELMILATAAAYVLSLIQSRRYSLRRTSLDVPIVLLLIAGLISTFVAVSPRAAAGIYRAYFVEGVAVFYIAVDTLREPRHVRRLLIAAGIGSSIFAVGEIATFILTIAHHKFILSAPPAFLYTSSNSVALYLEPPLAFAAAFALYSSVTRERAVALAFLAILVPGITLTLSRGAYTAVAVAAVVAIFTARDARQKLLITAIAAAGIIVLILIPVVEQRLTTAGISFLGRVVIFDQAWTVIKAHPLTGPGLASYAAATAPLRSEHQWPEIYPHNIWLAFWSETGLLGLVSFAWIYFSLLVSGWRHVERAGGLARPILFGSVGTLIVYLVHGLVDTPFWKNDLAIEFWLVAALTVAAIGWTMAAAASPRNTNR